MKLKKSLALGLLIVCSVYAVGASAQTEGKKPQPSRGKARLGTSFRFDGTALHGKYQKTPGTTATVENDKFLEDLLGARKSFEDRDAKDRERN